MSQTFYFYDLETSGVNARTSRIMQFAGQRTNMDLQPIGEPDNYLIKLSSDILPDPEAVLITGITPQQTLQDGLTEVEFLKIFYKDIAKPDTIFTGFNSVRFDDEFIRYLNYRNYYDAYEWQWQEGKTKWDMLDVSRMTRALRPDGIKWPFDKDGLPTNRLELLTKVNKIEHSSAHDALHDVFATIELAKLIKSKQPKLFDYLLKIRTKNEASKLVESGNPFIYTSGRYSSENLKTTIAVKLTEAEGKQGVLVYDLRQDPKPYLKLNINDLAERFYVPRDSDLGQLPVKVLQYNRCPAIAPISTLDKDSQARLKLDIKQVQKNLQTLISNPDFSDRLHEAYLNFSKKDNSSNDLNMLNVDEKLYDGFFDDSDKTKMRVVRAADKEQLADLNLDFADERLSLLLPLYKARNFPKSLNQDEQNLWQQFCKNKLLGDRPSQFEVYFTKLEEIAKRTNLTEQQRYLVQELNLYGESILPTD